MRQFVYFLGLLGMSLGLPMGLFGQSYADQSVLQSGTWYKLGIVETGMHTLDQSYLSELGIDVGSIDPRRIQIYGNGGGMLPQPNAIPRPDDLVQNPIKVQGEGDGSFDAGDYVAFFAEGPHTWRYDAEAQLFRHELNLYSDTNYYFLHIASENGLRISDAPDPGSADHSIEQLVNYHFHELELESPIQSGRLWLGERMDLSNTRSFSFYVPDAKSGGDITLNLRMAARSDVSTLFTTTVNGAEVGSTTIPNVSITSAETPHYNLRNVNYVIGTDAVRNDSLTVTLTFDPNGSNRSEGWLDWIEVTYDQAPEVSGRTEWMGVVRNIPGSGAVGSLSLTGAGSNYEVWDITDPKAAWRIPVSRNGSTLNLSLATDTIRRMVAFTQPTRKPVSSEVISNQNLHGLELVDYLILTNATFRSEANRLADFHRNHYGRSVAVVTVDEIYNEFSSGRQDVTAIRDFIRMQYVRSGGLTPGFVCFFGDGTYIYKYVSEARNNRTNYVPTYQSRDSRDPTDSFTSDDFFALMEENEGFWGEGSGYEGDSQVEVNTLDIAVGRLPIENIQQAQEIVDKIIRYATNSEGEYFGKWRNRVVLLADHRDRDGSTHVSQADSYTSKIRNNAPCINIDKIYLDNYRMVITAGNESFPEGRKATLQAMSEGSLIFNYTGHGSENAWSYSRVFQNADIDGLENVGRYPAVVTATCEFGRYDNPEKRSGGELFMMHPTVGAIAMFTTVRVVYSSPNRTLNDNMYRYFFAYDSLNQRMPTLGEIMMRTKNVTYPRDPFTNINSRNFTLLGDPGLILNYPGQDVRITSINEQPLDPTVPDTLRSLGKVRVSGQVVNVTGAPLTDFDGDLDITVFDKPSTYTTQRSRYTFSWQKNRIFNGLAEVNEGEFDFEFVVPIDISYEEGYGKISLYAASGEMDGVGCINNLFVGGTDPDAALDTEGPEVQLFINDTTWRDGGITSANPDLFALLSDENGINTTGTGIGHEITAVLDEDESSVFILNDAYTADPGSYQSGSVRFPLQDLTPGEHSLRIRVWDVANNASEDVTTFFVADNAGMALDLILNAPNPFYADEGTDFIISHNQDGQPLSLELDIFSTEGRYVHRITRDFTATGNVIPDLSWDGANAEGNPIANGLYIYRVRLTHQETGETVHAARRLVVIR